MTRAAIIRRALTTTDNHVLRAFRYSWDGSVEGARRFLDTIGGIDADTATRDNAADFIEDLIDRMTR